MQRYPAPTKHHLRQYNFTTQFYEFLLGGRKLRYVGSSTSARWRVKTLFIKEPTTVLWLDSFKAGEVLVDIGANVGMYSIYAAAMRDARVYAFEPESQNYAELNRNIYVNNLDRLVTALPLAMSDSEQVSTLHLSRFGTGWGEHNFENPSPDWKVGFEQGSVSASLDKLVESGAIPQPDHIKVDVDGIEWRVFEGMRRTLASPKLKSVLIETNFKMPRNVALVEEMTRMGWRFSKDQVRINQHEVLNYSDVEERMRGGVGGQNFIYYRDLAYDRLFADFAADFVPPNPERKTLWKQVRPVLGRIKRALLRPFAGPAVGRS